MKHNGQTTSFSLVQNRVTPTDTLNFDSSGNLISNTNQTSMQNYFATDSTGYCYSRILTADTGLSDQHHRQPRLQLKRMLKVPTLGVAYFAEFRVGTAYPSLLTFLTSEDPLARMLRLRSE